MMDADKSRNLPTWMQSVSEGAKKVNQTETSARKKTLYVMSPRELEQLVANCATTVEQTRNSNDTSQQQ